MQRLAPGGGALGVKRGGLLSQGAAQQARQCGGIAKNTKKKKKFLLTVKAKEFLLLYP